MHSTPSSPPVPAPSLERLVPLCLEHVAREEAQLDATLASLRAVREALLGSDRTALEGALERHRGTARDAEVTRLRRVAFQQEAAALLGVPADAVTLDLLVARLPAGAAGRLADARARLQQQADEARRLNDSNATLLYYCLDFLRRFFDGLIGHAHDGRYGAAGTLAAAPCGSLINARG
jgi:hypothetical protein